MSAATDSGSRTPSGPDLTRNGLEAAQGGAGRVGAVGGVGDQHLGACLPLVFMVGGKDQHAGQLALGAGSRLQGHRRQAGDFAQIALQVVHQLQGALGEAFRQQGMGAGESGNGRLAFVGLGVVFHGAGAQRVHAAVHAEIPLGKLGEVAHHIQFGKIRKIRTVAHQGIVQRGFVHVAAGQRQTLASR